MSKPRKSKSIESSTRQLILTFPLPDERVEAYYAQNGMELAIVISDILNFIRTKLKYPEKPISKKEEALLEELRTYIYNEMESRGVQHDYC